MLRILNQDFEIIETIPKCKSVTWKSRFVESGSFTIILPNQNYSYIARGNMIQYGDRYGIIEYIDKKNDALTIRGYDLKAVTLYRIADKKSYNGKAETVIKNIMSDNTSGNRGFENFSIADTRERGNDIAYEITSLDSVENHLKKICEDNEIGYDVSVSEGQAIFDICIPQTRDIVYSLRRKNISDYEYLLDALSQRNVIVCETKSEGFDLESVTEGLNSVTLLLKQGTIYFKNGACYTTEDSVSVFMTPTSPYVYATYDINTSTTIIDSYSYSLNDTSTTYSILLGVGTVSGHTLTKYEKADFPQYTVFYFNDSEKSGFDRKEKVGDCSKWNDDIVKLTETATASMLNSNDYKTKWNLGDFVTIKINIFGETISFMRQITEVEETFTSSEKKVVPTFGTPKENIIRKLMKGRK